MNKGKLYICPTPIGNLEDITLRAIRILGEVDLIAAEDTRHTIKLLNHFDIKKPLTSYHEHNIREKGLELIEKLKSGANIALVSDAGMPGISDPGYELIREAIEEEIDIVPLPGATASITALVVSGLCTHKFTFQGFLSSKRRERIKELEQVKEYRHTTIIYESPHRLINLLEDMEKILGNRKISISRELTKRFEETYRGTSAMALEKFRETSPRGEFVIIIEGNNHEETTVEIDIAMALKEYIDEGYTNKDAIKKLSKETGIPRNLIYKKSLED